MDLSELLKRMVSLNASDLLVVAGSPPVYRIHGDLTPEGDSLLRGETIESALCSIITDEQKHALMTTRELDFAYSMNGRRYRVNYHFQRATMGAAFRLIASSVPSISALKLPNALVDFSRLTKGLVLVTGPTGHGKSTTLAAIIDLINSTRPCHIITIEDPIEFLHTHRKSIIEQREVGSDTRSFAGALRHVLRQDPDVILVGEMRDPETIATAITAAETGHLVFSTLHTNDTVGAIDRMIDVFAPGQQAQIRMQLSLILEGIAAQQLLPLKNGAGRVPAVEILKGTPAIRNLIRQSSTHQIYSQLQTGAEFGMQTMDMALKKLIDDGEIIPQSAVPLMVNKKQLEASVVKT